MRGRTNTITTVSSKKTVSTSKRTVNGGGPPRLNSAGTRTSSGATSIIIGNNPHESNYLRPSKLITQVDGIFVYFKSFFSFFLSYL
jgi:hypothetical protein